MNSEANGEISNEYYKKLNQQIVQKDNLIKLLQLQIRNLKTQIDSGEDSKEADELQKALDEKKSEAEKLLEELEKQKEQFQLLEQQKDEQIKDLNRILEEHKTSEKDLQNAAKIEEQEKQIQKLKAEIEEAREAVVAKTDELEKRNNENNSTIEELKSAIESLKAQLENAEASALASSGNSAETEELISKLAQAENENLQLKENLLQSENERDELKIELAAFQTLDANDRQNDTSEELESYKLEVSRLIEENNQKDEEIARLRVTLEASKEGLANDLQSVEEIEQLTNQVADQLLSIQSFESKIKGIQEQLFDKETEISNLKRRLEEKPEAAAEAQIPVEGENAIISSFIDFFDGLDSIIAKNPIPELQVLHRKLLDRLIIPNQISYMQVISETFNPHMHVATDYFHSDKFPERCIVFESEKGYTKGDLIVKKAKVWVVQNLYNCVECGTMQSNADSRYCHLCGAKIVAPNGLAIDSLPEFEANAVTYHRFAERMLAKDRIEDARQYILDGLAIDSDYVPLITGYADILAAESNFAEALEMLNKANSIKFDAKTDEKIKSIETKLSIYNQAKNLKLSPEEIEKLLHLIQK